MVPVLRGMKKLPVRLLFPQVRSLGLLEAQPLRLWFKHLWNGKNWIGRYNGD